MDKLFQSEHSTLLENASLRYKNYIHDIFEQSRTFDHDYAMSMVNDAQHELDNIKEDLCD